MNSAPNIQQLEQVVVGGNLASLSPDQRVGYYHSVCQSLGLNPLTKPFEYLTLNGKLILYARKDATEQLRKLYGVSIAITSREKTDDVYVVTARASAKDGRSDESIGAVSVAGLKGEPLANAIMKAETKAKRRVTLSVCGLGMLDETEVETIPGAVCEPMPEPKAIAPPPEPEPKPDPKPAPRRGEAAKTANERFARKPAPEPEPAPEPAPADPEVARLDMLDEIAARIKMLFPERDQQKARCDMLAQYFGTRSWTSVRQMAAETLRAGLEKIARHRGAA